MSEQPRIGRYRLVKRIGSGGMAEVFLAIAPGERFVAFKRIRPDYADRVDFVKMLIDEARLVSHLSHPGIATVTDLGRADGSLYMAMEYVPGRDLGTLWKSLPPPERCFEPTLAAHVGATLLEALDAAHAATDSEGRLLHVVHRDVSPSNVLVTWDGDLKLIDFGIASAKNRLTRTATGIVKGKFRYMAPEQVLPGMSIDGRVDVYAASAVMYELLSGARYFAGLRDGSLIKRISMKQTPKLEEPELPPRLLEIVNRGLEPDRELRWPTAGAMATELRRFIEDAAGRKEPRDELANLLRETFPEGYADEQRRTNAIRAAGAMDQKVDTLPDPDRTILEPSPLKVQAPVSDTPRVVSKRRDRVPPAPKPPPPPVETLLLEQVIDQPTRLEYQHRRRRSSAPTVAVVVALAALVLVGLILFKRQQQVQASTPPVETADVAQEPEPPSPPEPEPEPPPVEVAVAEPEPAPAAVAPPKPKPRPKPPPPPTPTGRLRILSNPPGELWLNGEKTKHTTPVELELEAGPHLVWVEDAQGRRAEVRAKVPANRLEVVTAVFSE